MPITSYAELSSAAGWYPCPPTLLYGILAYGDILTVSWVYRGLTLVEGRPDVDGVHAVGLTVGVSAARSLSVQAPSAQAIRVTQPAATALSLIGA